MPVKTPCQSWLGSLIGQCFPFPVTKVEHTAQKKCLVSFCFVRPYRPCEVQRQSICSDSREVQEQVGKRGCLTDKGLVQMKRANESHQPF